MPGATRNNVLESPQSHFPTGGLLTAFLLSLLAPVLGILTHLPPWVTQIAVYVVGTPVAAVLGYLAKRWARKRWPDRNRKPGDTDE